MSTMIPHAIVTAFFRCDVASYKRSTTNDAFLADHAATFFDMPKLPLLVKSRASRYSRIVIALACRSWRSKANV